MQIIVRALSVNNERREKKTKESRFAYECWVDCSVAWCVELRCQCEQVLRIDFINLTMTPVRCQSTVTLTDRRRCVRRTSVKAHFLELDDARCMSGGHLFSLTRPSVRRFLYAP